MCSYLQGIAFKVSVKTSRFQLLLSKTGWLSLSGVFQRHTRALKNKTQTRPFSLKEKNHSSLIFASLFLRLILVWNTMDVLEFRSEREL